ncbi:MAG: NAD(P)-binding domain-containing protein [Thermoleophilaceae bacterium]|nr:NAD(P)-binding domain-containing protein [Thermoleophilaceae bacterium]
MRVAVIGAGPSGLASVKELAGAGIDVTCFEKGERLGGIWAFNNASGLSPAYRTLHLNTSRARTEYGDFPMAADDPDFPSHWHMADYFNRYVDHFAVRDRIRFNSGVAHARRPPAGGWELELESGARERFDGLVVANGHNWSPRWPDPPYPGTFDGTQTHAHSFRDNQPFVGRRVLVVGMGNSAMDIAVESSMVAERTFLSTRNGSRIVPKYLFGGPADQITSPVMARVHWRLRQPLTHFLLRLAVGDPVAYGLPKPAHGFLQDHPTVSDTILSRLTHGEVTPKPGIGAFAGNRVEFTDGSSEQIDTIVWCTGYHVTFPFFKSDLLPEQPDQLPLYQRIFPFTFDDLFFVGLVQSTGSAIPIVEQQAKLVAAYLAGNYGLPDADRRHADVEPARRRAENRYGPAKRPAMRIDFDGYMREISRERVRGRKRAAA